MGEFSSNLLELAAFDDLLGFKLAIEQQKGHNAIDDVSLWYGRRVGSRKMGLEERTPLMVAAMHGSKNVLNYIISTGRVDVNRASGTDGATALHCAAASGFDSAVDIVKTLLSNSANSDALDSNKKRPSELIPKTRFRNSRKMESLLSHERGVDQDGNHHEQEGSNQNQNKKKDQNFTGFYKEEREKHDQYPLNISLPDINNEIFGTDEFRMYSFKIKPCSRAYSHDWTECPFAHPGENAKRRDPRKFQYSCVPCPDFRKGSCSKGENCEFSHGIFESWLHPAQYRTRLCKDGTRCSRKVCFFAHKVQELRPLYASTGSAIPPSESYSSPSPPPSTAMDVPVSSVLQVSSPWRTTQSPIAPPRSKSTRTTMSTGVTNTKLDGDSLYSDGLFGFQSNNKSAIGTRVMGQSGNQLQSFRSYHGGYVNSSLSANSLPFSLDSSGSSSLYGRLSHSYTDPCLASHNFESLESFGFDEPDLSWVQSLLSDASSSEFLISKVGSEQMVA